MSMIFPESCPRSTPNKENLLNLQEPLRGDTRKESTEDSLRDRRMERGGVDGNVRYDKSAKNVATGSAKKKYDGMSALEKVKADIRAKHGKGAIMDTKKK